MPALDSSGLKIVAKQLSNLEQATIEERAAEREAVVWLRYATFALATIAVIAVFTVLNLAKMVAMPVIAGIVVGLILGPIGDKGKARGIPTAVTFATLSLIVVVGLYLAFQILAPVVQNIVDEMPNISRRLTSLTWQVESWFGAFKDLRATHQAAPAAAAAEEAPSTVEMASKAVEIVTPAISQFFIFLFTLILFFASRQEIRQALALRASTRQGRLSALKAFANVENELTGYFFTVTMINAGLGGTVGVVFLVLGVPGALTWGFAAFVLNYLPVIGPLIIKASLLGYGLIFAPNLTAGLLPISAFLTISLLEANAITPKIVGHKITMNPLLVFIAVVFWTWMWGFAGAFLAMPILAVFSAIKSQYVTDEKVSIPS